jgi:hypothetical protein
MTSKHTFKKTHTYLHRTFNRTSVVDIVVGIIIVVVRVAEPAQFPSKGVKRNNPELLLHLIFSV